MISIVIHEVFAALVADFASLLPELYASLLSIYKLLVDCSIIVYSLYTVKKKQVC